MANFGSIFGTGGGGSSGFFGSSPMIPASGGGFFGSQPNMAFGGGGFPAPQAPVQNWQSAANPVQAYQQYENDYANYVNQNAAYQNALRGQGQPQGFATPGGGFGGMMGGGPGGFDINAIMQLLQRMGMGGGGGGFSGSQPNMTFGAPSSQPMQPSIMNSISQMVAPQNAGSAAFLDTDVGMGLA